MTPVLFTTIFVAFLMATTLLRLTLARRQFRHVSAHRGAVPAEFSAAIPIEAHQKAADYTVARVRLGMIDLIVGALYVLILTLGGVLQALHEFWQGWFAVGGYAHGIAFIASIGVLGFAIELPFGIYRTFIIEERFGFNKMNWRLYVADIIKEALLTAVIGVPVLLAVLWLMNSMGERWWLYVWLFWLVFNLLVLLIYPTFIAPLFNKFSPLSDESLAQRIEALLGRCGFRSSGLYVMDGSRRSAHGNAYFTGFGSAKRIVFFDTLLGRLQAEEIEAVIAHELGHYKLHHIWKRLALMALGSLAFLWLLGYLIDQPWFYQGLGVTSSGTAVALVLFSLVIPVFAFPLAPVTSALSRRHEFEADAYAAGHTRAADLISALVKLYRENAATLTPDPVYSTFYDSHPPAAVRIARLRTCQEAPCT